MMAEENQEVDVQPEENVGPTQEETTEETQEEVVSVPKKEYDKLHQTVGSLKRELKDLKKPPVDSKQAEPAKADGLDETQLDYLDLKGVSADEDIDVVRNVMKRTGQTVREALKDEYVQAKLKANQEAREVRAAIPKAVKRGAQSEDTALDVAIAKFRDSGYRELPSDTDLRRKVVNAVQRMEDPNKPAWG